MSLHLTGLEKKLCNLLQEGLPVCPRPFAETAKILEISEETILRQVRQLKKEGIIRRIGAVINYHALGKVSTLVTAHIQQENVQEVAEAVNLLTGVSHNYLRRHHYNLWFTLQADSPAEIEVILSKLSGRFGVDFHELPVERVFKLDVRFNTEEELGDIQNVPQVPITQTIKLNDEQKLILTKLQNELEIIEKPFDFLCEGPLREQDVLEITASLMNEGVISRIGAVVDHRKLGFAANVLFVCEVSEDRVIKAGRFLASFGMVSHCYQRETFEGWPYNLFAMMHGRNMGDIQRVIDEFIETEKIASCELLPTAAEFKKQPVRHRFD